jgi:hypothetical protein
MRDVLAVVEDDDDEQAARVDDDGAVGRLEVVAIDARGAVVVRFCDVELAIDARVDRGAVADVDVTLRRDDETGLLSVDDDDDDDDDEASDDGGWFS